MQVLERDIEKDFRRRVKAFGCDVEILKYQAASTNGYPDRVILCPNAVTLWIEFKAPGKEPTPLQAHRIERMRELGHRVQVFDDAVAAALWVAHCSGAFETSNR